MTSMEQQICSLCKKKSQDLQPCSKCRLTRYCSSECQKKDWDRHQQWCQQLQAVLSRHTDQGSELLEETDGRSQTKSYGTELSDKDLEKKLFCSWCQKACGKTFRCPRCEKVIYCSKDCQKEDQSHALNCRLQEEGAGKAKQEKSEEDKENSSSSSCGWCRKSVNAPLWCSRCMKAMYCSVGCKEKDWKTHRKTCKRSGHHSKRETIAEATDEANSDAEEDSLAACAWCQTCSAGLQLCSGCKIQAYCSKECQKKDWMSGHKNACKRKQAKDAKDQMTAKTEAAGGESEESCQTCESCGIKKADMKSCGRCREVFYCSRECQRENWHSHKSKCIAVDGVIKTKKFQRTEQESYANTEHLSGFPGLTPMDLLAMELGFNTNSPRNVQTCFPWPEAKKRAQERYPGWTIVESFENLPGEFFWYRPTTQLRVLLARISSFHPYSLRHAIYIRDVSEEETVVMFYCDNPRPFFTWNNVVPGNYICIENAVFHNFLDGTVGFRINEASDVKILGKSK